MAACVTCLSLVYGGRWIPKYTCAPQLILLSETNQLAHKHVTFRTDKAVGIKHFVMSAVHKHNVLVLQLLTSVAPDS